MTAKTQVLSAGLLVCLLATWASGDGMIVPVRPDLRVRGDWAVKYHHVHMTVRDQVASVTIDQEFVNTSGGMIEVEYLFPVPPHAAIDSMTLIVDGREFPAKVLDADEARRIYEDIVRRKRDPALLEYVGFGLIKTSAFPLEPNKPVQVVVTYKNICRRDRDTVEVWYPLNTEKFSAQPIDDVKVTVDVQADSDVSAVYSPTHNLNVERKGPRRFVATYHEQGVIPTTDFQVFYKASAADVGATLLTHQPVVGEDGYFMLLVSPNPRSAAQKPMPKDVVVVLDRSGSMSGEKFAQARESLRHVLGNLNADDRFNVVVYSDIIDVFFDKLQSADESNVTKAIDLLDRISATGGTNIRDALVTALEMFDGSDRPGYVLFLTDGLPTVGERDESKIISDVADANQADARLFAFGVGYDVNVRLLDTMSQENGGLSEYVKPNEPVEAKISSLYNKIRNPVMTDLSMELQGLAMRDIYPRELGDLFDGDQIVAVGRYDASDAASLRSRDGVRHTTLVIRGRYQGNERAFEYPVTVNQPGRQVGYDFVEKLWAMRRVGWLLDQIQLHGESGELVDELIRLSRDYGIMTPYTAFLADESAELGNTRRLSERFQQVGGRELAADISGPAGQVHATNRQNLARAERPQAAAEPGGGVYSTGYANAEAYETEQRERIDAVRQVGNQALYRRGGNLWVTPATAEVDLSEDAEDIEEVELGSEEYFELVRANTAAENRLLATQQHGEELLVELRGQLYRIR
ncbi:MAG: VIT domain-containing protein [Phycisphaerae bacterium]